MRLARRPSTRSAAALFLALTACCVPADDEAEPLDAELARHLVSRGLILPLEHFVRRARQLRAGELLDVRLGYEPGHRLYVYEVWMLGPEGHVWEVEFDAGSGALIEHEREDD